MLCVSQKHLDANYVPKTSFEAISHLKIYFLKHLYKINLHVGTI